MRSDARPRVAAGGGGALAAAPAPPRPAHDPAGAARPVVVATMMRPEGDTGVQTHFNTFVRWAERAGAPVRLLTPFDVGPALAYPVFGVGRLAKPFSRPLWMWWYRRSHFWALRRRLLAELDPRVPTVVYAQDPLSARAAIEARDRGYAVEVAMVVHFNVSHARELAVKGDIPAGGRVYREIVALERQALTGVDRLIFPSRFIAEAVLEHTPESGALPSYLVPNFVAAGDAAGEDAGRGAAGELVSIGTVEPRKNHAFLLHVLAHARRLGHRYRLTIVGDGGLRRELAALADTLGVAEQVTFAGFVPNAAAVIPRHAVYVHAAQVETFGIVLLEAFAAGRPVCAAPVGGIPEVLADGVEGFYWDLADPASAAETLVRLLEDPRLYERMARAARARYEREFAVDVLAPRLLDAVLGARARAGVS